MKLEWFLTTSVIGMLAAIGAAVAIGEPAASHGQVDISFTTLQVGGDGADRLGPILWLGWLVGALQIGFLLGCLALGLRRASSPGAAAGWRPLLLWGGAIFQGIWTALVVVYSQYASSDSREIVLGLPTPTAIMLYGIWLFPAIFCVFYVLRFDSWVLSEADLSQFRERIEQLKSRSGPEAQPDSAPNAPQTPR